MAGLKGSVLGPYVALLQAVFHYCVHHVGQDRPAQWLLSGDLLWLQLNQATSDELVQWAMQLGVEDLLDGFLQDANARFYTGIDLTLLVQLQRAGKLQWRSGIMRINDHPMADRAGHERKTGAAPQPDCRRTDAEVSRTGMGSLPWLYARRAMEGWGKDVLH